MASSSATTYTVIAHYSDASGFLNALTPTCTVRTVNGTVVASGAMTLIGDGGIYVKKGVFSIMLCGSKETVHGFAEWTRPICGTTTKPRNVLNIYHFSLSANMAKKVCAVLYANDPKYYLERKAKTMQSVLNIKLPAYAL